MAKKVETKGKKVAKPVAVVKPANIAALLKQLETADDQLEKRKIRAKLRKAGHTGGIVKKAKVAKGAKGKSAKKAADIDEED